MPMDAMAAPFMSMHAMGQKPNGLVKPVIDASFPLKSVGGQLAKCLNKEVTGEFSVSSAFVRSLGHSQSLRSW